MQSQGNLKYCDGVKSLGDWSTGRGDKTREATWGQISEGLEGRDRDCGLHAGVSGSPAGLWAKAR